MRRGFRVGLGCRGTVLGASIAHCLTVIDLIPDFISGVVLAEGKISLEAVPGYGADTLYLADMSQRYLSSGGLTRDGRTFISNAMFAMACSEHP